jgi:ribosomal-protein-alanine N-acetyltransferase
VQPVLISTNRAGLEVREITIDHIMALCELILENHEHLIRWCPDTVNENCDQRTSYERYYSDKRDMRFLNLGIWYEGTLIGGMYRMKLRVPYHCEIGYWLDESHTGSGFATAALQGLLIHIFEVDEQFTVVAKAHVKNKKSHAVLERAGFRMVSATNDERYYRLQAHQRP